MLGKTRCKNKPKSLSWVLSKFFVVDPATLRWALWACPHPKKQNHSSRPIVPHGHPHRPVCSGPHLQLLLPLQGKLFEGLDNETSVGAVVDEYGGAAHPCLQVIYRQGDVLSVVLEKKTVHVCDSHLANSACSPAPAPPRGSHAWGPLHRAFLSCHLYPLWTAAN